MPTSRIALVSAVFAPLLCMASAPTMPVFFVRNTGQFWSGADFVLESRGMSAQFRAEGVVYRFADAEELRVRYIGCASVHPQGLEELNGHVNYLVGADESKWKKEIPVYSSLAYREMWPGIDVAYAVNSGELKSEFQLAPQADAEKIRWSVEGATSVAVGQDGSLLISGRGHSLREAPPQVFEQDRLTGELRPVHGAFRVLSDRTIGVSVGDYDHANRLIFDPVIGYSTYFGGTGQSTATSVAIDSVGNTVIAGYTSTLDLAPQASTLGMSQRTSAFVAKLSASGNQLIFCTYLGGNLDTRALALALDRWNNIYIAGTTSATNFPVAHAVQTHLKGGQDAFVAELNPTGATLVFSTYLGGGSAEQAYGVAVNRQGNVYVAGDTLSSDFPTNKPFQSANGGGQDGFLVKLGISGSPIIWSSYLGGSGDEHVAGLAVDATGAVVVTGSTLSSNFPVVNALQPQTGGNQDAFVTKVNAAGTGFTFSTYLGGSGGTPGLPENGSGVAVDGAGAIYVTGTTSSDNFPVSSGAFQTTPSGGLMDAFAVKLSASGGLVYGTLLGGSAADYGSAVAVDVAGNAHIAGYTASPDFPSLRSVQSSVAGSYDAFITKLNSTGTGVIYSTLLGGSESDSAAAIAVDRLGTVVIAGQSLSNDFPVVNGYQTYLAGAGSALVARLPIGWTPTLFNSSALWTMDSIQSGSIKTISTFGIPGQVPIVGDWTGTGHQNLGVFQNGTWFLDLNGDGAYGPADRSFVFGQSGDIPIVGDWDGSGTIKAGLFRNGTFILDYSGHLSGIATGKQDVTFLFGQAGDIPVAADWNSTGPTKVGVFRAGVWLIDYAGTHVINGPVHSYGLPGDIPLLGDWDGSGVMKAGVYRKGTFLLDYNGSWTYDTAADVSISFGTPSPYALIRY